MKCIPDWVVNVKLEKPGKRESLYSCPPFHDRAG
jgi:hypothetical protein